jgi:hypothetical protein
MPPSRFLPSPTFSDSSIRATPPAGDNAVVFVATRDRFAGFAGGVTTTTPTDIQVSAYDLHAQLQARLALLPRARWGITSITARVVE